MKKRILFCSSFIDQVQTGSAIFAQLVIEWAERNDIELDIISSEKSERRTIPLVKHNRLFAVMPVLQIYHRSYIYYKTVQSILKEKDYDYVFFNSVVESLHSAKLIKNTPVRAMLHDENFMCDYKVNPSLKRRLYRKVMHKQEKKACQFLDKILTNSKYMKSQIESIYDMHPLKVNYSYFRSFDFDDMQAVKLKSKEECKTILFVKHDYERGGLVYLAEAIRLINQQELCLKVIGVPSNKHREISRMLSGIKHEIISKRSRDEIYLDYLKCTVFCVPSQSEALGLANLEAMITEKPVVAFDIPVMQELNKADKIMDLAAYQNIKKLAEKIEMNLAMGNDTQARILAAKSFVEEKISKDQFHSNLNGFFAD